MIFTRHLKITWVFSQHRKQLFSMNRLRLKSKSGKPLFRTSWKLWKHCFKFKDSGYIWRVFLHLNRTSKISNWSEILLNSVRSKSNCNNICSTFSILRTSNKLSQKKVSWLNYLKWVESWTKVKRFSSNCWKETERNSLDSISYLTTICSKFLVTLRILARSTSTLKSASKVLRNSPLTLSWDKIRKVVLKKAMKSFQLFLLNPKRSSFLARSYASSVLKNGWKTLNIVWWKHSRKNSRNLMLVSRRKKVTDGLKSGFPVGQVNCSLLPRKSIGLLTVVLSSIKLVTLKKLINTRHGNQWKMIRITS